MLARIRGDTGEEQRLSRAAGLVRARAIESEYDLAPLVENPPEDADPEALRPLQQLLEAGTRVIFESAVSDLPDDLRSLYETGVVTIEQLASLNDRLGVTSVADLADVVGRQLVKGLPGLDEPTERNLADALGRLRQSTRRIPLGRAVGLAEPVLERLRAIPSVEWTTAAGSLRRGQDLVGDIDLVAATTQATLAGEAVAETPGVDRVLHRSPSRIYLLINRTQVGVRLYEPDRAGSALLYLTGSASHYRALRARAAARGWQLTVDGLREENGAVVAAASEGDLYAALGLPFIPAEIREDGSEIDAAERGELPPLLTEQQIRGDLHMHSVWSDGQDSIERMVQTCSDLDYEYVAITDHSQSSAASRNLSIHDVSQQADEVAALRERFPRITILHGCEVDILPDGHLDFPDRVLEQFDIVLASLHERAGHAPDELLRRYVSAMHHPLVTLITHPTNRQVPHRAGYQLDYDRLFETAVATGTLLEVDGAPAHLDMEGSLARRAIAAGATLAVNSDCHRAELLQWQMRLGVITARRGWVEARHVVNTRPVSDVRALIARKRSG